MAFCLFKLKNSLIHKASFAIYSARLPASQCFACQLESVNGHCVAIARTSSTAIHYKLYHDQIHPLSTSVSKPGPQANPSLGVKDCEDSTVGVGLSELFYRDPLTILLNSRLLIFEDVRPHSRSLSEDTTEAKVGPKESLKYLHRNAPPSVRLSHTPQLHQELPPFFSSPICCLPITTPVASDAVTSACVGSQLPGPSCGVMLSSPAPKTRDASSPAKSPGGDDPHGLPSEDKLQRVHDVLVKSLSQFFTKPLDYSIYDKNVIFENRFRGTVTKGLSLYAMQMALLNTVGHLKHAAIKLDIIKTTVHPEEGTIKVRWRIKGLKPTKAFYALWVRRYRLSEVQATDSSNWYDGFSTFHVNSEGLVIKHVADNMMPDDDKLRSKAGVFAKMAALLGLMPRPAAGHSSAIEEIPPLF